MKKFILLLINIIISLYLFSCQKPAVSQNIEFIVDIYSGQVDYSENSTSWSKVQVGMKLREGGMLRTGSDSFCDIIMPDRGVFRLSSVSVLSLDSLKKHLEKLTVKKGKLLANIVKPLGPDEDFLVETSTAVVSVRGTEFLVDTDGQKTVTAVKKGRVAVRKNVRSAADRILDEKTLNTLLEVPVGENENLEVDEAGNRELAKALDADLADVTNAEEARKIVSEATRSAGKDVKKIADVETLEREFRDITAPGKLKKIEEESEQARKDWEQQEKHLEKTLESVKKKAGLKDIAGKKVGDTLTTAEEDIRSGAVDKKVSDIKSKLSERSSGRTNKAPDGEDEESALERLKGKAKKAIENK